MVNTLQMSNHPDVTPFTPNVEGDTRRTSEGIEPAEDFYGRRDVELARQAVREALHKKELVRPGISQESEKNIETRNNHLHVVDDLTRGEGSESRQFVTQEKPATLEKKQVQYIAAASQNISGQSGARQQAIDAHWKLEEKSTAFAITEKLNRAAQGIFMLLTGNKPTTSLFVQPRGRHLEGVSERELIQRESAIGGQLFEQDATVERREFFNLNPTTWIWHEEIKRADSGLDATTTRYEIQEKGILKAQDGVDYFYIEGKELQYLTRFVQMYYERVLPEIYHRNPVTGEKYTQDDFTRAA